MHSRDCRSIHRGRFTYPFALPDEIASTARLGFFPGSTIGNLTVPAAVDLLRAMAVTLGGRIDAADRHRPYQGSGCSPASI